MKILDSAPLGYVSLAKLKTGRRVIFNTGFIMVDPEDKTTTDARIVLTAEEKVEIADTISEAWRKWSKGDNDKVQSNKIEETLTDKP